MKSEIKNIEASVGSKLHNIAKASNMPYAEVLQYYGIERFIYRMSVSRHSDNFVLKGALLFMVWDIPGRRTTIDIDVLARMDNQVANVEKIVREVCGLEVKPDGLMFDAGTVRGQKIKEGADYEGVRVKFSGMLERARIPMQIDFGFGDVVYPESRVIDYPVILDSDKPRLRGYPPESVISEKFESMVKLGLLNSRMKDFYDVWLMIRRFDFDGGNLAESLHRTFQNRNTPIPYGKPLLAEEIYDLKSDRQTLWTAFLKKNELKNVPVKLGDVAGEIESFLIEILEALFEDREFTKTWKAPGPWA